MKSIINVSNEQGKLVVSSREISVNFEKRHDAVLRDIENLISNVGTPQDCGMLFIESKYINANNRTFKEYLLTRDGFSLLVMGFTGQKALEWKLKYIEAFNKMEHEIQGPKKLTAMEQLRLQYEVVEEHEERLANLENTMTIDYGQQRELQNLAKSKAMQIVGGKDSPVYKDNKLRTKVFSNVWNDFKDYFEISSYRNTPRKDLQKAIEYIQKWQPQGKLLREIEVSNSQISI